MTDEKAEADTDIDEARVDSRATGGVDDADDRSTKAEEGSTTSPTPDDEYVGRIAGDDAGDVGESGAEARAQAD